MLTEIKVLSCFVCSVFHESEHQAERRLRTVSEGIVDVTNGVRLRSKKLKINVKFAMKVRFLDCIITS